MAEPSVSPKKPAADDVAAPAVAAPPPPAAPDLSKLIVQQGDPQENFIARPDDADPSLAGKYRLVHGTINFGYNIAGPGEAVATVAHPGAIVMLTAAEAKRMLADKTVTRIA